MAAVGINMQELDEIIVDEDFASMLEQYEKKESEKVSQGEIVSIENGQVIIAVPGEKKEGVILISEIQDSQGNLLFVNSFNFESPDDVLYYILYVWKQAGMDQQKDQLRLFGEMSLRVALTETLRNYLQYVDLQEIPSEAYLLGSEILQAPLDLIALSICES